MLGKPINNAEEFREVLCAATTRRTMFGMAVRLVHDDSSAQDLVQEVSAQLLEAIEKDRIEFPIRSPEGWLRVALRYAFLNLHRSEKRERVRTDQQARTGEQARTDDQVRTDSYFEGSTPNELSGDVLDLEAEAEAWVCGPLDEIIQKEKVNVIIGDRARGLEIGLQYALDPDPAKYPNLTKATLQSYKSRAIKRAKERLRQYVILVDAESNGDKR